MPCFPLTTFIRLPPRRATKLPLADSCNSQKAHLKSGTANFDASAGSFNPLRLASSVLACVFCPRLFERALSRRSGGSVYTSARSQRERSCSCRQVREIKHAQKKKKKREQSTYNRRWTKRPRMFYIHRSTQRLEIESRPALARLAYLAPLQSARWSLR